MAQTSNYSIKYLIVPNHITTESLFFVHSIRQLNTHSCSTIFHVLAMVENIV